MPASLSRPQSPCISPTRPAPRLAARRVASGAASTSSSQTSPPPVLPIVILPGLGNASTDYAALAAALLARGAPAVAIAPVARPDWLRNAAGLLRKEYWSGDLTPAPTTDWYMERIEKAVSDARTAAGMDGKVALLAHSAGGWLARTWLLSGGAASVASLTTLGSPHAPPPPDCGLPDQTRGILTWVDANTPGAFHKEILYTTVAGRYLKGAPLLGGGGNGGGTGASVAARMAGVGYEALCGDASTWGDAITPVVTAHLEGATQVTLEGVFHGPLGASPDPDEGGEVVVLSGDALKKARFWYGSAPVIDSWAPGALGLAPLGGRLLSEVGSGGA